MPRMPSLPTLLVLLALLAPLPAVADATADLHALFEREWERDLADNPLLATYRGDRRYDDLWPDISPAAMAKSQAADARVLEDLAAIARGELPPAEQLNYDLFRFEYEDRVAAAPFHPEYYSITARGGPQTLNETAERMRFDNAADFDTWLRRLERLPAFLDQYGELLKRAAAERRTQPRVIMERVLPQLVHGGPGKAGGGEELGGARGLALYLQRTALEGSRPVIAKITGSKP